jgi:hypothetical protein
MTPLAKAAGHHFALGAGDQLVLELAGAAHRAGGNRAVMAGDEIHQAEVQHLQPGKRGEAMHIAQCAVGFDQDMDRNPR